MRIYSWYTLIYSKKTVYKCKFTYLYGKNILLK